jgi:filamentous hemagglutinin
MHPRYRNTFFFFLFLLGILVAVMRPPGIPAPLPRVSPEREQHILYGDATGGGHLHGIGKPCKSEFPASWDAKEIISKVRNTAANDNINWRRERNGYHVAERMIGNVRVRIVLDEGKDDVVTAYPLNLPRNPCPANDP